MTKPIFCAALLSFSAALILGSPTAAALAKGDVIAQAATATFTGYRGVVQMATCLWLSRMLDSTHLLAGSKRLRVSGAIEEMR
jgi:hypothetical protein